MVEMAAGFQPAAISTIPLNTSPHAGWYEHKNDFYTALAQPAASVRRNRYVV